MAEVNGILRVPQQFHWLRRWNFGPFRPIAQGILNTDLAVHHVSKFTCIESRGDAGSMSGANLPHSLASPLAHATMPC